VYFWPHGCNGEALSSLPLLSFHKAVLSGLSYFLADSPSKSCRSARRFVLFSFGFLDVSCLVCGGFEFLASFPWNWSGFFSVFLQGNERNRILPLFFNFFF